MILIITFVLNILTIFSKDNGWWRMLFILVSLLIFGVFGLVALKFPRNLTRTYTILTLNSIIQMSLYSLFLYN